MANTKKYVSLDKLGLYDEKIKKVIADADAAALAAANKYADGLAVNYDAAGAAATAEANAKAYADGKDAAIQAAQKAGDDAAAAAAVADGKAVAAQGEVDALETYVGTFTHDTAKSVVEYINAKTDGIATSGNLEALGTRVTTVEGKVATIEGDYLKAADKTELEGKISAVQTAVDTEKSRAEGIEGGLRTDVDAIKGDYLKNADKTALQGAIDGVAGRVATIEGDYLKGADKTELQGKIDAKVAQTDYDAKMEEIDGGIEGLQTQINTIMNNPDAEGAINSINEFTKYVADHGEIADGFRADINKNKEDIAAEVKRAGEAEAAIVERLDALEDIDHDAYIAADEVLAGRIKTLEDIDHDAYVDADTALENKLNGEIAKKADVTALNSAVETLTGADSALSGRIATLEGKFGEGDGSVADLIATAKQEAIDAATAAAASDAATKDEAVLAAAKKYADDEDALIESRVATLETASATHALASDVTALTGRVTTVEGKVGTLETEMDAVEALAAANKAAHEANAAAIALKADATALTAVSDRVTALETWHNNFTEVSEQEINDLFK